MPQTLPGSEFHLTIRLHVIAYNASDRLEKKESIGQNKICQITKSFVTTIFILT